MMLYSKVVVLINEFWEGVLSIRKMTELQITLLNYRLK